MFLVAFLFGFVCGVGAIAAVVVFSVLTVNRGRDDDEFEF